MSEGSPQSPPAPRQRGTGDRVGSTGWSAVSDRWSPGRVDEGRADTAEGRTDGPGAGRRARLLDLTPAGAGRGPGGRLLSGIWVAVLDESWAGTWSRLYGAALRAVLAAHGDGYRRVVCGSSGAYGLAVAWAAAGLDVEASVVLPVGVSAYASRIEALGAQVVQGGATFGQVLASSRAMALSSCADVNVGGRYAEPVREALGGTVESLRQLSSSPPAGLWLPMGSGATVAAVGHRVRAAGWSTAVYGVALAGRHSVVTSWPGPHRPVPTGTPSLPSASAAPGWPLGRDMAEFGAAAMDALAATDGAPVGVEEADLVRARELLARRRIRASAVGSAGLAGLLMMAARGRRGPSGCPPPTGSHVAVVTG